MYIVTDVDLAAFLEYSGHEPLHIHPQAQNPKYREFVFNDEAIETAAEFYKPSTKVRIQQYLTTRRNLKVRSYQ